MKERRIIIDGNENVYNVHTGDEITEKVSDAPFDGTQYARENGEWTNVTGGGDGAMVVEASPIGEDGRITFSKTFLEVLEAYNNNKRIVMYTKLSGTYPIVFFELQAVLPNLDGGGMVHQLIFSLIKGNVEYIDGFRWEYSGYAPEGLRENVYIFPNLGKYTSFHLDQQGNLTNDSTPRQVSNMLEGGKTIRFTLYNYDYYQTNLKVDGYIELGREYGHKDGSFDICCMINEYSDDESTGVLRNLIIKGNTSTDEWTLVAKHIFDLK